MIPIPAFGSRLSASAAALRLETANLKAGTTREPVLTSFSIYGLAFAWMQPRGFGHYLRTHFLDKTFQNLYQPNAFDMALLIPYFIVLILLASYGVHRYSLVYHYYKNRKNRHPEPAARFGEAELPRVTVQLPIFNEQFVVDRLVESICRLDYPREKLDIQVLDDSTDETVETARQVVERYAALGYPISYHHRANRHGYKAGALQEGLRSARGEFVAVFDADFTPPPEWLRQVIHYFTDPQIGMVQTRWTHINRNYSFLTEVEAILLDGHFVLEHGARFRSGVFFNFNGTAGMWRRQAIDDAGGWEHDTLTEDTDLSYRAQMKGWRFAYIQDIECPAELPVEMTAFKTQQARWAKGLVQVALKIMPRVLKADVPLKVKLEAWYHLTANISYPLMILLSVLLLPAMVIRFYQGWFQMLMIDVPLFVASTFSISSFYLVSQKELYPRHWYRTFYFLPFLMALGVGLTVTNSRAVLEALFGKKTAFARTPKYRVVAKGDKPIAGKYRKRLGVVPWIELAIGSYFFLTVLYAVQNENYITVPFLGLFVLGYWCTGLMSLLQGRFERFPWQEEPQTSKPFPAVGF
jgi:cellulose synthase/poly-beta-1,6-N-acetylglucosamine synthase-like glycosyltransferase